jgi:hypothetical protein
MLKPLTAWGLEQFGKWKFDISGDARLQPLSLRLSKRHFAEFAEGGLEAQLDRIDASRPIKRIFVMGCGRSGTWLLTGLMSTFKDSCVVAEEVPVEFFARLTTTGDTLVLKRNNVAFERFAQIPTRIKVAYIIRHPYDVLSSHNPTTGRTYHITTKRWLHEMAALKTVMHSGRANLSIIRYEDLVTDPEGIQLKLAAELDLIVRSGAREVATVFNASPKAKLAMHGLRGIDTQSLYKYKDDPKKLVHLRSIKPELGGTLSWVASHFGYDTSFP